MFQRMGLLLIVGLMACGGEFEDDGRVAFPMRIVFNDHSAASADLELTYTLTSPDGFVVSEGPLASLTVLNGIPTVLDAAFYAKPGDSFRLSMVAAFNDGTLSSDRFIYLVREGDVAIELGVNYLEQEDSYVLTLKPYVPET